jgi:adenylate cyclase
LFADLRGFTSLAETMPPADCYRLLGEVMESLTEVVMARHGIVVDYFGDGLLAMWNAPLDQPDHADFACGAALDMLNAMPQVAANWNDELSKTLQLGIGVHSGPVLVGNAGATSRLKYGPRGSNVNLASRVQAATRQLDCSLLVTAATKQQLSNKFFTLRTCTARLPGLEQPVELFAVYPASETSRIKSRLDQYAHALRLYEQGNLIMAEVLLSELVATGVGTPARFLAQQAASQRCAGLGRRASDRADQGPIVEIHVK